MHIIIHEDRPECLVGIKLLLLSLARHCPELPVILNAPDDRGELADWTKLHPRVTLRAFPEFMGMSWNIKPGMLLKLLDEGYEELLWIDSDIIVARDFRPIFEPLGPNTLVGAQEPYWGKVQGTDHRTVAWGLPVGKPLPTTFNSGVLRVTERHRVLLESWSELLLHPAYTEAQSKPGYLRPIHLLSDQEVLTALLGSAYFADLPVLLLKRGAQIAQLYGPAGYRVRERLANLGRGVPPFVHAMGRKPWTEIHDPWSAARTVFRRLDAELSLYSLVAREYAGELGGDTSWMWTRTLPGRLMGLLSFGSPHLHGLPLAVLDSALRSVRRRRSLDVADCSIHVAKPPVNLSCLANHERAGPVLQPAQTGEA